MTVGRATTIGPVSTDIRDRVKEFRDARDKGSYNAALETLLNEVDHDHDE